MSWCHREPRRHWLSDQGLLYAVGMQSHQLVYVEHATKTWPRLPLKARRPGSRLGTKPYRVGRTRVRPVASHTRHKVGPMLAQVRWRRVTWRLGTKGHLSARFVAVRVRVADGQEDGSANTCRGKSRAWSAKSAPTASAATS